MKDGKTGSSKREPFASRLRRLAKEKGYENQTLLSDKTGIDRTRINRLLNGHGKPQDYEIAIFAQMFGISQEDLLDGVEIPQSLVRSFERHRELLQRTLDAERGRDEATARADALRAELDRQAAEHEASYAHVREKMAVLADEMSRLEQELHAREASLDAARVKHQQAINKLTAEYVQAAGQLVAVRKRAEELERLLATERAAKEATKGLALFTGIVGMGIGAMGASRR